MSIPKLNDSMPPMQQPPQNGSVPQHNNNHNPSMSMGTNKSTKKKMIGAGLASSLPLIILVGVLAIAVVVLGYLYWDSKQENEELKSQQNVDAASQEYQKIVDAIKQLVDIPDDERVNVAKVDNTDVLKEQNPDFYKDVQNGQYLIVMPKSQRVMIYDKEKNKIVNFSSYTIRVELIPEEEIDASEKPLKIEIRYTGDVTQETLDQVQQALSEASQNYEIVEVNMTNKSYEGLTVVLLNREGKPKMSQNIIAHSGTNSITEKLPEGEAESDADVVLFLGSVPQTTQSAPQN